MRTPAPPEEITRRRDRPPAPATVSEQAQHMLNIPDSMSAPVYPELDDTETWVALVAAMDAGIRPFYESVLPPESTYDVSADQFGNVPTYVARPTHVVVDDTAPLFIGIHGGGLYLGGGDLAWMAAASHAVGRGGVTWAPDRRMPPRHPFPAALDDLGAVYRAKVVERDPSEIIVGLVSQSWQSRRPVPMTTECTMRRSSARSPRARSCSTSGMLPAMLMRSSPSSSRAAIARRRSPRGRRAVVLCHVACSSVRESETTILRIGSVGWRGGCRRRGQASRRGR